MEEALALWLSTVSGFLLSAIIIACLVLLGKGADWLVGEAVLLSTRSGLPKVVIGATIVSLGTTTPEAVVSVLAALQGRPGLALGNAVGSIICDTGLILGLACLIAPLPLNRQIVNRQGWIQVASGFGLVLACLPWPRLDTVFSGGGVLPRAVGLGFLCLLALYLAASISWARNGELIPGSIPEELPKSPVAALALKLLGAIFLVVSSSWILIPSVGEAALRLSVPESIIAATLVAFGTSLPELVTAIVASWKGHGELAVGNVIGADILNVLFVAGSAAAVTPGGLEAPAPFFTLYFPSMILVLVVFRVGVAVSGSHLRRPFGVLLLVTYMAVTILSYTWR